MRELKNWTITAKAVKHGENGLLNYVSYLNDSSRHKEQIITKLSDTKSLKIMLENNHNFELQRRLEEKRHKGGRPSNVGWSSVFSYPFDMTNQQFILVKNRVAFDFYTYVNEVEKLGLSVEEIQQKANEVVGVIHNGNNVKNHMHLIFDKIFLITEKHLLKKNEKKLISVDLTKKKYLYNLKKNQ